MGRDAVLQEDKPEWKNQVVDETAGFASTQQWLALSELPAQPKSKYKIHTTEKINTCIISQKNKK